MARGNLSPAPLVCRRGSFSLTARLGGDRQRRELGFSTRELRCNEEEGQMTRTSERLDEVVGGDEAGGRWLKGQESRAAAPREEDEELAVGPRARNAKGIQPPRRACLVKAPHLT